MSRRQFACCLLALLWAAAVLLWMGRYSGLDLALADGYYDAVTQAFPARDDWFFEFFMHRLMKALMLGLGMVPPLTLLADRLLGRRLLSAHVRKSLGVLFIASLAVPLAIGVLKHFSIHHCPWAVTRYGGVAPYLRLFDALPAGTTAGRCFPAGHASSALWLAAAGAFWLPQRPGLALAASFAGLLPGLALGWAQQVRGAHFLTHTLWSAWIAALMILLLYRLAMSGPAAAAGQASGVQACGLPVHGPGALPVDRGLEETVDSLS